MSAPATNDFSPFPVITMAHTAGTAARAANAASISPSTARLSAFSFSSRDTVTSATAPRFASVTLAYVDFSAPTVLTLPPGATRRTRIGSMGRDGRSLSRRRERGQSGDPPLLPGQLPAHDRPALPEVPGRAA